MEVHETLERVAAGLTALAEVDLDALSDVSLDETLIALQHLSHRMAGQVCRYAHRWEQRGVWSSDGSKSSWTRLARDGHTSKRSAQAVLLRGRALDGTPAVAAAFHVGELSADQVDLLVAARHGREELFARDEDTLVNEARRLRVAELVKVLAYWRQRADAELGNDGPEPKLPEPHLTLTTIDGAVTIDGELDPVGGQIVQPALDAIAKEIAPTRPELSPAGLRAVALVEMARRAMAMPAEGRPARVLANVVIGHDRFTELCELSNGTVIRPGHLVPYLDALDIRSILFDSATHAVATSTRRTFVGSVRAVVEVRDLHCQHPSGCDEPIDRCDADHIEPKSFGGETSQDNGRLLCTFHNRIEPQYARPPDRDDDPLGAWTIHHIHHHDLRSA